ncbi:homeobox protein 13 [Wyeomyia smithii]|uniref:homeobox protein 13 n=1 Tax=Wyeomyia smithii TaxID=174621 RepID=UPI002467DB66|nr:homeobox protein 13 [Wyeomyia smithii]
MCKNFENNSIMAHGLHSMIKSEIGCNNSKPRVEQQQRTGGASAASSGSAGKMGSRRIFTPQFKLQVLDSYRNDGDCKGNQRATARKYGIHRRQIQKWLQVENNLRSAAANSSSNGATSTMKINLMSNSGNHPHHPQPQQQHQHQPQFQLHHPHHHHHIHHQNLNSIELKVPMDSTRHRVAQNASSNNNNNNNNINGKESSVSACIISPVSTHTLLSPFSHPHHESSSSSASLSVLKPQSRDPTANAAAAAAMVSQVLRPNFSPVSGDFPAVAVPTHHSGYEQLNLLDTYYHYCYPKCATVSPIPSTQPIDLSRSQQIRSKMEQALSPCSTVSSVYSSRPRSPTPTPVSIKCEMRDPADDCEVVDLSCRKRKACSTSDDSIDGASPPKSVKLFKPYLLDEKDDEKDSSIDSPAAESLKDGVGSSGRLDNYPIIWNFHAQQRYYENLYEYNSGQYVYPPSPPYIHQPPLTPIPRTPYSTLSPSPPSSNGGSSRWAAPQASPVSGYDSSTSISSVYSTDGNDDGYSYSLELKQQAIDSYYHDVSCRGDFRAVASKYNINRKYVEKWLAQEDHLAVNTVSSSNPPPPLPPQVVVG